MIDIIAENVNESNFEVYRVRRAVYEQLEPFLRKVADIAIKEGFWELID